MLISPAFAQTATESLPAAQSTGGVLMSFLPLFLIFAVFYVLLIRPQQKKLREHQNMLEALRKGDKVVTGGGIIGVITKIGDDNEVQVEIADGVRVRVQRGSIGTVLAKTQPVNGTANDDMKAAS